VDKQPEVRIYESGGLFGWMLVASDNTIHASCPQMFRCQEKAVYAARTAMALFAQAQVPETPSASGRRFLRGLPKGRK